LSEGESVKIIIVYLLLGIVTVSGFVLSGIVSKLSVFRRLRAVCSRSQFGELGLGIAWESVLDPRIGLALG
jgi:hypothetical protein